MRKTISLAAIVALSLGLAGCGSDNASKTATNTQSVTSSQSASSDTNNMSTEELSGAISGAGASSQRSAMDAWRSGFSSVNSKVQVTYDPVGSGAGVKQLAAKAVAWAGSDAVLHGEQVDQVKQACGSDPIHLPVYISPIAIVFNIDGVKEINLDASTIAKIFAGKITKWNDPAIMAQNEGVNLPDLAITPVHRSDKSGTTYNFTQYLKVAAGADWPSDPAEIWPVDGGESGKGTSGLVQVVQAGQGTIGYADASKAGSLGQVLLKVNGKYTKYTAEAAAKTAAISHPGTDASDTNLTVEINRDPKEDGAYPLILISYSIACSKYEDANTAKLVKAFLSYEASVDGQKLAAEAAGSAPITDELREKITKAIDSIK